MELSHGTFRIQVDDILAKGDRVVVLCTESAQPGGRSWSSTQVHVWTVKDGRAASSGSTRAISRPKTSSARRQSNQKVGRSLRKARRSASLTGKVLTRQPSTDRHGGSVTKTVDNTSFSLAFYPLATASVRVFLV